MPSSATSATGRRHTTRLIASTRTATTSRATFDGPHRTSSWPTAGRSSSPQAHAQAQHQRLHGVTWGYKKWVAKIQTGGAEQCLGSFEDIEDALRARIAAEIGFDGKPRRAIREHAVRLGLIDGPA